jgi:hypothetical protein
MKYPTVLKPLLQPYKIAGGAAHIAFFAFIACATAGSARLQAISGHALQANPSIAVQQKVELL